MDHDLLPDPTRCSVARTLAIVGEKWTLLVLQASFFGIRRFEDFQRRLNIPRPVLSNRLTTLVEHGLLRRVPYREQGQRERYEYRLSATGRDLYPALVALMRWGDRYLDHPGGLPVLDLAHRDCDGRVEVTLVCEHGHQLGGARETIPVPPRARPADDAAAVPAISGRRGSDAARA
jgi:DNA-binding HxlR family transcriptional regulator